MSCLEHLIENGLYFWNEYHGEPDFYNKFINRLSNDINISHTNLDAQDVWMICQYIQCSYLEDFISIETVINRLSSNKDKIIERMVWSWKDE